MDIDIEQRPAYGGKLKIIAMIEEPAVIERILTHIGLSPQPPCTLTWRVDLFQSLTGTRMNADIGRFAAQPEFQERLLREGAEHEAMTLERFAQFIRSESARWAMVIR